MSNIIQFPSGSICKICGEKTVSNQTICGICFFSILLELEEQICNLILNNKDLLKREDICLILNDILQRCEKENYLELIKELIEK